MMPTHTFGRAAVIVQAAIVRDEPEQAAVLADRTPEVPGPRFAAASDDAIHASLDGG
jgi:hypothetical protein